ncbi:hypothetical protein J4421_06220 [Candidatus Woesearchaeota archaeon]|nr:hypothetical protein [Candidatus Woesearchaeota archaeon]
MNKKGELTLEQVAVWLLIILFILVMFSFIYFLGGNFKDLIGRIGGLFG